MITSTTCVQLEYHNVTRRYYYHAAMLYVCIHVINIICQFCVAAPLLLCCCCCSSPTLARGRWDSHLHFLYRFGWHVHLHIKRDGDAHLPLSQEAHLHILIRGGHALLQLLPITIIILLFSHDVFLMPAVDVAVAAALHL